MPFRLIALLVACLSFGGIPSPAEETETPKKLLEFVRPGMKVGLHAIEGTASVSIKVYSQENFRLAKEVGKLRGIGSDAEAMAEGNPAIRKKLNAFLARLDTTGDVENRVHILPLHRGTLGTVTSVGDDYILVESEGQPKSRRVLPQDSIGSIYLDSDPVRFIDTRPPARRR